MYNYYPKRPIKSFQDLEVYQKLLGISVTVAKRIKSQKAVDLALDLPVKVATAHSLRFADSQKAISTLEEIMLGCNLLVVYLEQYRDIFNIKNQISNIKNTNKISKMNDEVPAPEIDLSFDSSSLPKADATIAEADITDIFPQIETEFFEEQIKALLSTRMKIMHLQMSWKKFSKDKGENNV